MRRFWVFWNSYITVMTSPGWTCTERWSGRNSQGPRAFASNSTVMVRLVSIWVFLGTARAPGIACSASAKMLIPVYSQIARYMGTRA